MKVPAVSSAEAGTPARVVLRPNCSLSHAGAIGYFLGIGAAGVVLALLCWRFGAWPVVPYLALELAGIGFVLWLLRRHAHDREVITLDDDRLCIERRDGVRTTTHEFQRYWARIKVEPVRRGWHPSRLLVRSHGREVEIGAGLLEEERLRFARRLKQVVGHGVAASPAPDALSGAFDISRFKSL